MSVRDDLLAIPNELLRSGRIAQAALVHMDFKDTPPTLVDGLWRPASGRAYLAGRGRPDQHQPDQQRLSDQRGTGDV